MLLRAIGHRRLCGWTSLDSCFWWLLLPLAVNPQLWLLAPPYAIRISLQDAALRDVTHGSRHVRSKPASIAIVTSVSLFVRLSPQRAHRLHGLVDFHRQRTPRAVELPHANFRDAPQEFGKRHEAVVVVHRGGGGLLLLWGQRRLAASIGRSVVRVPYCRSVVTAGMLLHQGKDFFRFRHGHESAVPNESAELH